MCGSGRGFVVGRRKGWGRVGGRGGDDHWSKYLSVAAILRTAAPLLCMSLCVGVCDT